MSNKYIKQTPIVEIGPYSRFVPFHLSTFVTEHTLTTNDEFVPVNYVGTPEKLVPVAGYGAFYRIIGDGAAIPTFDAAFKKSSASGDYDETIGVLNLITFVFDGFDFWYSIVQEA
jgi:hypothetical protein